MNVLGVTFDSKLQWGDHSSQTIKKANIALHAIRLIKSYFKSTELRTLITSNFYSGLLYFSDTTLHIITVVNKGTTPITLIALLIKKSGSMQFMTYVRSCPEVRYCNIARVEYRTTIPPTIRPRVMAEHRVFF